MTQAYPRIGFPVAVHQGVAGKSPWLLNGLVEDVRGDVIWIRCDDTGEIEPFNVIHVVESWTGRMPFGYRHALASDLS